MGGCQWGALLCHRREHGRTARATHALQVPIEHHVLWGTRSLSAEELRAQIEERFPVARYQTLNWVNPVELQTVTAVSGCAARVLPSSKGPP